MLPSRTDILDPTSSMTGATIGKLFMPSLQAAPLYRLSSVSRPPPLVRRTRYTNASVWKRVGFEGFVTCVCEREKERESSFLQDAKAIRTPRSTPFTFNFQNKAKRHSGAKSWQQDSLASRR
ncbi:unnamed protein product [Protopolystoma xenopodis]|uniref:Uncharacterized protein n=1 Tax=Protopolystoma xenopodis TaxID=117903 RepID=A0A3S5BVV0_9PLAT|nr:unnamed protein product [Protopolystoma xenopodis]